VNTSVVPRMTRPNRIARCSTSRSVRSHTAVYLLVGPASAREPLAQLGQRLLVASGSDLSDVIEIEEADPAKVERHVQIDDTLFDHSPALLRRCGNRRSHQCVG